MEPDYTDYIFAAYGIGAALLLLLVASSLWRARAVRRQLRRSE